MPSKCMFGFLRNMKRVLNCPLQCGRGNNTSNIQYPLQSNLDDDPDVDNEETRDQQGDIKTADNNNVKIFTSTVGKASGKTTMANPIFILQDIIVQLEAQNKALKNLSGLFGHVQQANSVDRRIQQKIDTHWGQITLQINRLKVFRETLQPNGTVPTTIDEQRVLNRTRLQQPLQNLRMEAFELFSPIPVVQKECYNETTVMEHKTLGVDCDESEASGKTKANNGITPRVIQYCDDSVTKVSMGDISTWFCNETDAEKANAKDGCDSAAIRSVSSRRKPFTGASSLEDKFNADLESVATSNNKMKELNADLDSVLDRLQSILANNFTLDETNFDNTQLKETANEMEGLLGSLIRGVEQRRTFRGDKI